MPEIGALIDFVANTKIVSSDVDQNFADIRTAFNNSAVLTDVARTITVTHTYTASQKFDGGASFGAAVTMAATLAVTGVATFGTTVTSGAGVGDVVLANAKALRGVNAAGTGTQPIVSLLSDNATGLGYNTGYNLWNLSLSPHNAAPAAGTTVLTVLVNNGAVVAERRVELGAADSAGTGFRTLRIAN